MNHSYDSDERLMNRTVQRNINDHAIVTFQLTDGEVAIYKARSPKMYIYDSKRIKVFHDRLKLQCFDLEIILNKNS